MTFTVASGDTRQLEAVPDADGHDLKVMHVITDLDVGGAERMLVSYLTSNRSCAPDCFVVSLLTGGYFAELLRGAGLFVHEMNMGKTLGNLLSLFKIAALIRHEKPDVIQSWMYHADLVSTLALLISGRIRKTHLYWGVRCSDMVVDTQWDYCEFSCWNGCPQGSRLSSG